MNQSPVSLPVRAADELLRYNESDGMFDVSYSAAWELGRLLALQNKKAATGIYQWKRQRVQRQKQFAQSPLDDYLPGRSNRAANGDDIKPPADLCGWFEDLSLLKGVPFNYLVPDERMLPGESIRFFQLDKLWIDCLLDGAFSIGRATGADYRFDQAVGEMELPNNPHPKVYGFLLRSEVVAGWSSLLADAYAQTYNSASEKSAKPVKNLRRERLSANVWLCLFEEEFRRIEFHLNPEALNFGLDVPDNSSKDFYKTLKDEQGEPLSDKAGNPVKIEFRNEPAVWRQAASGVVSTGILAALINSALKPFHAAEPFTSAHFALQMIEGIEKVIFEISSEQN